MLKKLMQKVDITNEWFGKIVPWFLVPMAIISTYEVIARYVFNAPTIWAWDVGSQLLGAMSFLCGGYLLLHRGHVAVDMLPRALSPEKKNLLELVFGMLYVFTFSTMLWPFIERTWNSIIIREKVTGLFAPPIYPLRVVATIGVALLWAQGLVNFIRSILALTCAKGVVGHER